jgi:hypothetical protein
MNSKLSKIFPVRHHRGYYKEETLQKISDALVNDAWVRHITAESLSVEVCLQCFKLWEEIENVQMGGRYQDRFIWKGSESRVYSAKATYNLLCQGTKNDSMHRPLWRSFAHLKCKKKGLR